MNTFSVNIFYHSLKNHFDRLITKPDHAITANETTCSRSKH
nr:MAG TPA: hypothetical protein [Caudoviricetes sp.]